MLGRSRNALLAKRARTLGFSIEDPHDFWHFGTTEPRQRADVKRFALKHVRDLETKIDELQAMSRTLRHLAHTCHGDDRPECPIMADLAVPEGDELLHAQKRRGSKAHPDRTSDVVGKFGDQR